MKNKGLFLYRFILIGITVAVTAYLFIYGSDYYETALEERFYHADHAKWKASGMYGHGLGIIGTLLITFGVFGYIYAKRSLRFERWVRLKYLLEFHIFLCVLGPIMVLFHTTFKFGGVVSIGFWSMSVVVLSGVAGRYIYLQIPRSLNGRELSLLAIQDDLRAQLHRLSEYLGPSNSEAVETALLGSNLMDVHLLDGIRKAIKGPGISRSHRREARSSLRRMRRLHRRIKRLDLMRKLFRYWHLVHRPFALIMLVIVLVHIIVTVSMGYTWTF